jgi:D-alanine-D-alanine ligase
MRIALVKSYTDKPWRSPSTFEKIESSLREKWDVTPIVASDEMILKQELKRLQDMGRVFVFNIAEYLDEAKKIGFLPGLLDSWGFPHLGSKADSILLGLDKGTTKHILQEAGIPTPQAFVARPGDAPDMIVDQALKIGYPLMVKPTLEGGHIGISEDSIVSDTPRLLSAVSQIFDTLAQPALVETYIGGDGMREFSIGVVDSLSERLFLSIEIDYEEMGAGIKILSHETAVKDLERIKPLKDSRLRENLELLAARTFEAVGASDYARVDIRMNAEAAYVLEINLMPGLGPYSFLPEAALDIHGLDYTRLVQTLAESSMARHFGRPA